MLLGLLRPDVLLTVGLNLALLVPVVVIAVAMSRKRPSIGWLVLAFVFLALNTLLLSAPLSRMMPGWYHHLHYNWAGKLLSLAFTVAFVVALPKTSFKDCGFTWKQARGSVAPALVCALIALISSWGYALVHSHFAFTHPDLESLLYEATIPGLHEEPSYRGVALLLLDRALRDRGVNLFGAPIGWGVLAITVFFGLGHGLGFVHGKLMVDWTAILLTGWIGFLLAWIRVRTGSLALPVVVHNVVNVGLQFIP
jgi:hypothetical protein